MQEHKLLAERMQRHRPVHVPRATGDGLAAARRLPSTLSGPPPPRAPRPCQLLQHCGQGCEGLI